MIIYVGDTSKLKKKNLSFSSSGFSRIDKTRLHITRIKAVLLLQRLDESMA